MYLLILAGGIVRSTGSGMGCPDWPKCFGSWVPPTTATQLPANYQVHYAEQRMQKNYKLAGYLEKLGFAETAVALRAEKLAEPEAAFNLGKTWTEYVNRLVGVVVGLLIMAVLWKSISYIQIDTRIFLGSLAAFLLVVFQGWMGSVVVSTNLLPWVVTIHMLLAIALVWLLVYLYQISREDQQQTISKETYRLIRILTLVSLVAITIQIALGTQVREAIDSIALSFEFNSRSLWIDQLGSEFYLHRSFSLFILAVNIMLYLTLRNGNHPEFLKWSRWLLALILMEIALGAFMSYFAIPSWSQPAHLLLGTLIIGFQFWLLLRIKQSKIA